jgi:periplasmic divalent cation tolerance protein
VSPQELLTVWTTVDTREAAERLARALLEAGLAACVQVEAIESFYEWDGALRQEPEFRLALKTTAAAYPALEAAILESHPYELPAIWATPVAQASDAFGAWVHSKLKPAG